MLSRRVLPACAALLLAVGLSGCAVYEDGYGGGYDGGNYGASYYAPAGGYGYGGKTVIYKTGHQHYRPGYPAPQFERPHHFNDRASGWGGAHSRDHGGG